MPPDAARVISEIQAEFTEPVRDPLWSNIHLSPGLTRVVQTRPFQRLRDIKQLGPAHLVYPGATHTRFNHSLGVLHLARRMIASIAERSIGWSVQPQEIRAFLAATLLHDLGHYPYAHTLKDLQVTRHEELTARLVRNGALARVLAEIATPPLLVAAIIDHQLEHASPALPFLRTLLAGVLDPDRLDYLSRDAFFCGVPYGIQDVDFVIGEIRRTEDGRLAITEKGTSAVESLLFARYLMYRSVYWHRTVRIATAMIKKAVLVGMIDGALSATELYGLTDDGFLSMFGVERHAAFRLVQLVQERTLYRQAFRIRFDEARALHLALEDPVRRLEVERDLCRRVSGALGREVQDREVVIDLPERNSFETDLLVQPDDGSSSFDFQDAGTVFGAETVKRFAVTLRWIAVIGSRRPGLTSALSVAADEVFGADAHRSSG